MSVSIKPLEDRIVVRPLEAEQTTASGLVIPDTAKEKPQEGQVVAVGPGRVAENGNRVPVDVAEGDVVLYSKYGGTEVKVGGEEYLVLSARDVLAAVRVFKRATSLGGVESLIEHRRGSEGPSSPVPDDLLRLSIGIEAPADLIADLEAALDKGAPR